MNAPAKIETGGNVYRKIADVQADIAKVGIAKNRTNDQQNYRFRGIDDVYQTLSPLLAKHGLCILPRMIARDRSERVSFKEWNGNKKESVLFYVTVEAEFDFVSADDGSHHTVRTFGEAMDSGDKATNKAMSAAYKYAAFMTFAIPTDGDNDADGTTHDVAPQTAGGQVQEEAVSPRQFPEGPARNITDLKARSRALWREIEGCGDDGELTPLLELQENRALLAQLSKLTDPNHRTIWEGDGKDNPGLSGLINRKRTEFAQRIAAYPTAG